MRKALAFLIALAAFVAWFGAEIPVDDDVVGERYRAGRGW